MIRSRRLQEHPLRRGHGKPRLRPFESSRSAVGSFQRIAVCLLMMDSELCFLLADRCKGSPPAGAESPIPWEGAGWLPRGDSHGSQPVLYGMWVVLGLGAIR